MFIQKALLPGLLPTRNTEVVYLLDVCVNKKENLMQKTQVGEEKSSQTKAVVSLAFRVKSQGSNLFSAEMLMLLDDVVVEKRNGIATTLGHAIGGADDLMDGWAFNEIEQKPEDFFRNVYL